MDSNLEGLNQLLWYYAELEKNKCYHLPSGLPDFDNNDKACTIWRRYANLFETSQSLFWASFGLVDLMCFELTGIKGFTRFWALLMFGSYSVINVIVLLNMLIAMMSNSYQIISERSDVEWKFARSRLWISYFDDGDTLPPPFNILPTPKVFLKHAGCIKTEDRSRSCKEKFKERARERHEVVMRLLIRRYITLEQKKKDEYGVTEDDVMEIRQDISTLKYELLDTLRQNGMRTNPVRADEFQLAGKKGKTMERRILKDFHIGIVEGIVSEMSKFPKETTNVFGHIAKAIGRRASLRSKKKDWNTLVRKKTIAEDPIGSSQEAENNRTRRQSLRQYILTNISEPENIDRDKLVEYNPNLTAYSSTTRLAYAKFMTKKIHKDFKNEEESCVDCDNAIDNTTQQPTMRRQSTKPNVKFASPTPDSASKVNTEAAGDESNKTESTPVESVLESNATPGDQDGVSNIECSSIMPEPKTVPIMTSESGECKSAQLIVTLEDEKKNETKSEPSPPRSSRPVGYRVADGKSKVTGGFKNNWL